MSSPSTSPLTMYTYLPSPSREDSPEMLANPPSSPISTPEIVPAAMSEGQILPELGSSPATSTDWEDLLPTPTERAQPLPSPSSPTDHPEALRAQAPLDHLSTPGAYAEHTESTPLIGTPLSKKEWTTLNKLLEKALSMQSFSNVSQTTLEVTYKHLKALVTKMKGGMNRIDGIQLRLVDGDNDEKMGGNKRKRASTKSLSAHDVTLDRKALNELRDAIRDL